MHRTSSSKWFAAGFAAVILLVLSGSAVAQTSCLALNAGSGSCSATAMGGNLAAPASGGTGFASVQVTSSTGALPVGTYVGWCGTSPSDAFFSGYSLNYTTASTYGSGITSTAYNEINYVLNNKQGTVAEVQSAIWFLVNGAMADNPLSPATQAMVTAAQTNGQSFVPASGQIVAVLLNLNFAGFQNLLIETVNPCAPAASTTTSPASGPYTTFTQGGWGAAPHGGNAGALLHSHFSAVFPGGIVSIGGTFTLTFTGAQAITDYLPAGGNAYPLTASFTNPNSKIGGEFAGQVLALQLAVSFSSAGVLRPGLTSLKVQSGPLAGFTVAKLLAAGNAYLGSGVLPSGVSASDLDTALDNANSAFDNGAVNTGFLK